MNDAIGTPTPPHPDYDMNQRRTTSTRPGRIADRHPRALLPVITALICLATGCANTRGPQLVVNSHLEYNKAVSQVLKQELLLNVVRRRYMEAPQFLNISGINSNFTTTARVGSAASVGDIGDASILDGSVDGSVIFSDNPTITITPRQGEDMATQLHQPMSVARVADLVGAGYELDGVFNALVEGVNNLPGPKLTLANFQPASPEWREAMQLITKFYSDGSLILDRFRWNDPYNAHAYPAESITPSMWITTLSTGERRWKSLDGGNTYFFTTHEMAPAVWLDPRARVTPEGQRLMELLNLNPDVQKQIWPLQAARVARGADLADHPDAPRGALKLRMRSLYNVLNFYSYGVQVPSEDEEDGRATDLTSFRAAVERGEIEDVSTLIAIRCSERPPESAFQSVNYRGLWFYIDDQDLLSKAGFNALHDLWQLSIKSPSSKSQPVTTIQVN